MRCIYNCEKCGVEFTRIETGLILNDGARGPICDSCFIPVGTRVRIVSKSPWLPTCLTGEVAEHCPGNGGYMVTHDEPPAPGFDHYQTLGWLYSEVERET